MQTGIWPKVGSGWTSNHTLSYFTFKGPVYLQIILWHPIPGPMAKTSSGSKDRELSSPLHPKALPLFHLLGHAGPHSPYMQIWISPSILRKWFIQQERKGVGNFWKFSTTCEVKGALVSSREPSLIYYYSQGAMGFGASRKKSVLWLPNKIRVLTKWPNPNWSPTLH